MSFFPSKMVFFHMDLSMPLFFYLFFPCCLMSTCCGVLCRRFIMMCFVADLFRRVVILITVSFFVVFTFTFRMTNLSNEILFVSVL